MRNIVIEKLLSDLFDCKFFVYQDFKKGADFREAMGITALEKEIESIKAEFDINIIEKKVKAARVALSTYKERHKGENYSGRSEYASLLGLLEKAKDQKALAYGRMQAEKGHEYRKLCENLDDLKIEEECITCSIPTVEDVHPLNNDSLFIYSPYITKLVRFFRDVLKFKHLMLLGSYKHFEAGSVYIPKEFASEFMRILQREDISGIYQQYGRFRTVMFEAVSHLGVGDKEKVASALQMPCCDINSVYGANGTALHIAVANGNYNVVEFLLTQPGIDIGITLNGMTVLDIAEQKMLLDPENPEYSEIKKAISAYTPSSTYQASIQFFAPRDATTVSEKCTPLASLSK